MLVFEEVLELDFDVSARKTDLPASTVIPDRYLPTRRIKITQNRRSLYILINHLKTVYRVIVLPYLGVTLLRQHYHKCRIRLEARGQGEREQVVGVPVHSIPHGGRTLVSGYD